MKKIVLFGLAITLFFIAYGTLQHFDAEEELALRNSLIKQDFERKMKESFQTKSHNKPKAQANGQGELHED